MDFLLNFYEKDLKQRFANTQPKLRTNPPKIAQENNEQTGISYSLLLNREEKNVHDHHRKKNLLGKFSGCKEKFSKPVVDTKPPNKNQETHIHHRKFPQWTPFFLQRKILHWSRAVYVFFFTVEKLFRSPINGDTEVRADRKNAKQILAAKANHRRDLRDKRHPKINRRRRALREGKKKPTVCCVKT